MNYRNAKFYDLKIKSKCIYKINNKNISNNLSPLSLENIAQQIETLFHGPDTLQIKRNGVCFYIADLLYDKEQSILLILLNKSDANAPDPTISNPDTKDRKTLAKPKGYGNEHSVHILISLTPCSSNPNVYSLVYESIRGCGVYGTHIRSFLNYLLKLCREKFPKAYRHPHPAGAMKDDKPVEVNSLHSCDLSGKISNDFIRDLEQGYLEGIDLINYDNLGKVWDTSGSISEKRKSISLGVSSQPTSKIQAIRDVFQSASTQQYKEAKIRFKDKKNTPYHISLFTDDFTLVDDDRYIKKTRISVKSSDESSFEKIHSEIKNELYKII